MLELTPYRFTGQEQDSESGLNYHHHRYANTINGRFLTPDPVFALNKRFVDPQGWSPYAYARNNPIRYVDPSGEDAIVLAATQKDSVTEIERLYEQCGGDCVTRMRNVYRKYFGDNSIGTGITGEKLFIRTSWLRWLKKAMQLVCQK